MIVYVLLEDLGTYDGGATIINIYATAEAAEKEKEKYVTLHRGFPEYRVEPHTVLS